MNKEEFLRVLEQKLSVLNDRERLDVLEEYSQHIDMKIESGQTEEEAVRDFGDPEELVADLLDAYHINSGRTSFFGRMLKKCGNLCKMCTGGCVRLWRGLLDLCVKLWRGSVGLCVKLWKGLASLCMRFWRGLVSLGRGFCLLVSGCARRIRRSVKGIFGGFRKHDSQTADPGETFEVTQKVEKQRISWGEWKSIRAKKRAERGEKKEREKGTMLSRGFTKCADWIGKAVLFCWKSFLFVAAIPVLLLGVSSLFLGGLVIVLLLQGYPLIGIGVGTLGVILSSFGMTALILSWVFTGKGNKNFDVASDEGEKYEN